MISVSKHTHRNKINLNKSSVMPVLCYRNVTWTLTQVTEHMLHLFKRKILRRIQDKGYWCPRWNSKIYSLYKDLNIVDDIKIRRLGWVGCDIRTEDERIPRKILNGKLHNTIIMKTKNKTGVYHPDGCIADSRNTGMEETSWR